MRNSVFILPIIGESAGNRTAVISAEAVSRFNVEELQRMHDLGVRGVRFNYVKRLVDPKPDDYYREIIEKIRPLGWHVVLYFEPADLKEKKDFFNSLNIPLVIDHMGRPDVTKPVDNEEFEMFLDFMRGNKDIWCKVSCPDRLTKSDTTPQSPRAGQD